MYIILFKILVIDIPSTPFPHFPAHKAKTARFISIGIENVKLVQASSQTDVHGNSRMKKQEEKKRTTNASKE